MNRRQLLAALAGAALTGMPAPLDPEEVALGEFSRYLRGEIGVDELMEVCRRVAQPRACTRGMIRLMAKERR